MTLKKLTRLSSRLFLAAMMLGAVLGFIQADDSARAQSPGKLPLYFVENIGQFDGDSPPRFQVHWDRVTISLADDGLWLTLVEPPTPPRYDADPAGLLDQFQARGVNLKITFENANPQSELIPFEPLDATISYFTGSQPLTHVPVWGGVRYRDLYPGLDLEISSDHGRLALRWLAHGDTEQINISLSESVLAVTGAEAVDLTGDNHLRLLTNAGDLSLPLPQLVNAPAEVGPFAPRLEGDRLLSPVAPAGAAASAPVGIQAIVSNPNLLYSTYLGGSGPIDTSQAVAVDATGHAYVTGLAYPGFPTTPGAFDTSIDGVYTDAYVVKLSPDGTSLVYATFFGGSDYDIGQAIAVDDSGQAVFTGYTTSADLPATPGAFDDSLGDGSDAFVAKLNAAGDGLLYATYLGGSDLDFGWDLALDEAGYAYVTGYTQSSNFPTTPDAFDPVMLGGEAYAIKLSPDGTTLDFGTLLGGDRGDYGYGIDVGGDGSVYVAGYTGSTDFPTTPGAFMSSPAGDVDAFVSRLNPTGSALLASTRLGGSQYDTAQDVAVDAAGYAYITGLAESDDFPTTPNAFDPTCTDCDGGYLHVDAYAAKITPTGTGLAYSTFLGGEEVDYGHDIVVSAEGIATLVGYTGSTNFPVTANAFDGVCEACTAELAYVDAFISRVAPNGDQLLYSSFLGGADGSDRAYGVAVADEAVYVTGNTSAPGFPVTADAVDTELSNFADGFVSKLALPPVDLTVPAQSCAPTRLADIAVGDLPSGLAVDSAGQRVFVGNVGSHSISVIDSRTNTVSATIENISTPHNLAFDPDRNVLWVSNYEANQVTALDGASYSVLATLDVGQRPWGIAYNPADNTVAVANSIDNSVSIIGELDGNPRVVAVITEGIEYPFHLAANPTNGKYYVANTGSVAVIKSGQLQKVVPLYDSTPAWGIAVDEVRDLVYVGTVRTNRIVAIGNNDQFLGWAAFYRQGNHYNRRVPLRALAVNPDVGPFGDGGHLWATTASSDGSAFSQALLIPKGWSSYFHVPIATPVQDNPLNGLAIDRATRRVYVSNGQSPGLVTVIGDHPALCPDWFAHTATADEAESGEGFELELHQASDQTRIDLTGDGVTDLLDLVFVAARYGTTDTTADLNGDGAVNILDLVMIAQQFTR